MVALEQFVFTALLMSHPHNYNAALRRREKPIAPRDVKRAIDYMQGHLDRSIRLADIVRASGVPGRTLFKHFSDCGGISPMRYLPNARLDKVREALRRVAPEARITEIAMQWGFTIWDVFLSNTDGDSAKVTLKRCPAVPARHRLRRAVRRRHFLIFGRHGGRHGAPNESIASRSTIVRGSRYSPTDQLGPGRKAGKSGRRSSGARSGHRSIQNRSRR
jgi:AraC-like DNA-binding protein